MVELAKVVLSGFGLVWLLSFWPKLDKVRELLGVEYELDGNGFVVDRIGEGAIAGWLNCPQCMGLVAGVLVFVMWALGLWRVIEFFALVGAIQLVVRYWETGRPKAEWWI